MRLFKMVQSVMHLFLSFVSEVTNLKNHTYIFINRTLRLCFHLTFFVIAGVAPMAFTMNTKLAVGHSKGTAMVFISKVGGIPLIATKGSDS